MGPYQGDELTRNSSTEHSSAVILARSERGSALCYNISVFLQIVGLWVRFRAGGNKLLEIDPSSPPPKKKEKEKEEH